AARRYCNGAKTLQRRDGTAVAQRHRGGAVRSPRSPSFKASRRLSKLLSPSFKAELRFRFEGGSISERALDRRLRRARGSARVFATRQPRKADSPLNECRTPATAQPPATAHPPTTAEACSDAWFAAARRSRRMPWMSSPAHRITEAPRTAHTTVG